MKQVNVEAVDDDSFEVEIFTDEDFVREVFEKSTTDPFLKINVNNRGAKVKRKYAQLQKKYVGIEGAESKYVDPETVNGYGLYEVVTPPYDLDALAKLFDESSILRSVVEARVMNTVGLGWSWEPTLKAKKQIEKANNSEEKAKSLRDTHQKHINELNVRFDSMNEEETFNDIIIRVWMDALVLGNGYLEVGRTRGGKIGYVGHVPGALVRIRRGRDGFVQSAGNKEIFFRNFGDKETPDPINGDPSPNELLHFKIYSPNNTYYGIPPSVAAISAIVGDKFAKEYNIDYFENKAIPRYAIILKGANLSNKSKKELVQYFKKEVRGRSHGTLVIPMPANVGTTTQPDVEFKALENDVQESSFANYHRQNRDEVITVYRVPPTKVGVLDNANLAVSRDADKTFKSQVVGPDQVSNEKKINRIVKEFSDLFILKFNQLDVIDEDMRSRIHDRYLRTEVLTPNEVRMEIGKEPISGGDKPLPYPVKAKQEADKMNAENARRAASQGGGQEGNTNAQGGSPPKSGQDNGSNQSNADATATNAERGQVQDTAGTRERTN